MFWCPGEGVERGYRLRSFIRFFHLMFIPLIPFERGSYVRCDACRQKFKLGVLQAPPKTVRPQQFAGPGFALPVLAGGMPMNMPLAIAPAAPPAPLVPQLSESELGSRSMTEMIRGVNVAVLRGGGATAAGRAMAIRNIRTRMPAYSEADLASDFKHLDLAALDGHVQRVLPTLSRETLAAILTGVARVSSTAEEANQEKAMAMLQTVAERFDVSDEDLIEFVVASSRPVLV